MSARLRIRCAGFTLIEVMIAVAIFVIVGALAMGGYNELVKQSDIVETNAKRTRAVQRTIQRMAQDFATLEPRPVREPIGDAREPALRATVGTQELVHLTHSGWSNPAGVSRSTLQRVAWRLANNELHRDHWVVLDRTLTGEPVSVEMLDRVRSASLRFLDQNQAWHEQWPPLGSSDPNLARSRPIAVEFTVELEDWGKIVRLVEVAG